MLRTNLDSMFTMTRPVIEGMRERELGRIINISSINGQKGQMGQVNYSAAKAGVIGFTKALALENARKGVTVNCICPGYIDTEMVQAVPEKVLEGDHRPDPGRPARQGRGDRLAGRLARLGRRRLHDRRGAHHQRRAVHRQRVRRGPPGRAFAISARG